jgi:hypothetical protein
MAEAQMTSLMSSCNISPHEQQATHALTRLCAGLVLLFVAERSALAQPAMRVSAVDGLTRVRPHDAPPPASVVAIQAARNEYEAFQVVVRAAGAGLSGVALKAGELRGPQGYIIPRQNLTLYREHYVSVTKPSPKSKEGVGEYPDALIPFINPLDGKPLLNARFVAAPFEVAANVNQPVWVDVFVPKNTPPGSYTGTITITAAQQKAVEIPVHLTVWNFGLPDKPSTRSNFGGLDGGLAKRHHVAENSAEARALERLYAQAMAAHRLCPPIPQYLLPAPQADGSIEPARTHSALREWVETFHVTGFPLNLIGGDPVGQDRARNVKYLQEMYSYLKANGWDKMAYIYVLDEPNDAKAYEQVRQRAKFIHETQPGIKVLCTEQPTPEDPGWGTLVGSVDIWVPLWALFEERSAAERLRAGDEIWSYTALCQGKPGADTPYWELDYPLLDYRIPLWMNWRYGITGLLYWSMIYWEVAGDVWTNTVTYAPGPKTYYNAEGLLFYPGRDVGFAGPVASIRLKQIREGLEDYEYFKLLADAGDGEFAMQTVQTLARSWSDWDSKPAALYAARDKLAQRLVAKAASSKPR